MKNIYNYCFIILVACLLFSCNDDEPNVVNLKTENPVATVESISPVTGYAESEITISGTEFGIMKDAIKVYVGDIQMEVLSCTENEIVVKVPEGATAGKITVEVFGQIIETDQMFDVLGTPGVTEINPLYGFPGDEIVFKGHDLGVSKSMFKVLFNGMEESASVVGEPTNEELVVKIPDNAKSGKIELKISDMDVNIPLLNGFTVLKHATVTGINSDFGYPGSEIKIIGENLKQNLLEPNIEVQPIKVLFAQGEKIVTAELNNESTTDNLIVAKLPDNTSIGEYIIYVSTSFEDVPMENPMTFSVKSIPELVDISPIEAHVGATVEISFNNIDGVKPENISVIFGEKAGEIISVENNVVKVKVPQLETGNSNLKLTINGAEIELGDKSNFEVLETPQITSVNIDNLLHNETEALVASGTELVISGEGFGTKSENVTLKIGGVETTVSYINDTEIKFNVPSDFNEGLISMEFKGIETPVDYDKITFKSLNEGDDITEYVLKNYKQPFVADGDEMQRSGEWMKPLDWVVENRTTDGMAGFGLQLGTKGDKATGKTLALQTDWGFPNSMINGKIYQNIQLVSGKYKLTANVSEAVITGNAYLAVGSDTGYSVTTDDISGSSFAYEAINSAGNQELEFTIDQSKQVSVGFVATLTAKQRYVKIQSFTITYLGDNQN